MFDRFTERARKVIILAKEEAKRFNHDYIGTEHILLGLIKEGESVAAAVLQNLGLSLDTIRLEVEKLVQFAGIHKNFYDSFSLQTCVFLYIREQVR